MFSRTKAAIAGLKAAFGFARQVRGNEGRNNQDSVKGWVGRAVRERIYVATTPQRYGNMSAADLFRDPKAWLYLFGGSVASWMFGDWIIYLGGSWLMAKAFFIPAIWRICLRAWFIAPTFWAEGARHVFVLYAANGYWHKAEYVHGKGELVEVVVDSHGAALNADTHFSIVKKVMGVGDIDWGEQDEPEDPRDIVRIVRTYRRRPAWYNPLMFYPRTSVGFASHVLGIRNPLIRTPGELLDYCERDAVADELVDTDMTAPTARAGYG